MAESGLVSSRSAMPRQVAKLGWNLLMRPSTVVMKVGRHADGIPHPPWMALCTSHALRTLRSLADPLTRAPAPQNGASFETYVCFNRKKVTFMETDVYDHMLIRGATREARAALHRAECGANGTVALGHHSAPAGVRDTSLSRRGRIANFMEKYSGK